LVKEEVPPSGAHPPLATNLLAPQVASNEIIREVVGQEEEEE